MSRRAGEGSRDVGEPRCAIVEECSSMIGIADKCVCLAPEEGQACAGDRRSDEQCTKVTQAMKCYADACREPCGL